MENKELSEKEKQSQEDWKMIKSHKPFYLRGNNVSYSDKLEEWGKTRVLLNNFFCIVGLIACFVSSFCTGWFGFKDKTHNQPLIIVFYVFLAIDAIVLTLSILNFVFNHVYVKQYKNITVVIYCNFWLKILEINHIQKDYGSFSKIMIQEIDNCIITVKGKNIEIKEKN